MIMRRVMGHSMTPTLRAGTLVVAWQRPISQGDIVIARAQGREVVKRVASITDDKVYLLGDNVADSTDSRVYGAVDRRAIVGVVRLRLPTPSWL